MSRIKKVKTQSENQMKKPNLRFKISKLLVLMLIVFVNASAQDTSSTALPLTAGVTNTVDVINGSNIVTGCSFGLMAEWYSYTPTQNYSVTVTSDLPANICKDTYFNVYTGTASSLVCLTSDDDGGVLPCNVGNTNSFLSKKTFDVTAGVTYFIAWTNRYQTTGFDFQLLEATIGVTLCSTAIPITAGITTVSALNETNQVTTCSTASLAKWYKYIPTQSYILTITSDLSANICKDTNFSVYTGSCTTGLTCIGTDDNSGVIACNIENTNSNLSTRNISVNAGFTYYIVWDNKWSADGFDFKLIENLRPCITAPSITAGITTVNAIDGINISSACSSASAAKWFKYTPSQDFKITISSDLSVNICKDTNFNVYKGSCPSGLTCFSGDDNSGILACNSGNTLSNLSTKKFEVEGGVTYYIAWDNKWSALGFDFQITEEVIVVPVQYTTQTIPTITGNYNLCVVDMNNDHLDDIVGIESTNIKIHYQKLDHTFAISNKVTTPALFLPTWSIAAGDYNKDGFNDLLYGAGNGLTFMKSDATGSNYSQDSPGQYIFCQRTNFVDLNDDGHLDAFSCHDVDPNVYYLNDGVGNFTYYQSGITQGAYNLGILPSGGNYASLWTDYDNDGDSDLFVSKCSGPPSELHRNDGNGVYTDISTLAQVNVTPIQSWSSAVDDFDNDGDMDIMIGTNGSAPNHLFRNDLDKTNAIEEAFADVTAGSGFHTNLSANRDYVSYDFDNDGFVDILGSGNKIMFNKGNMIFEPTYYPSIVVGAIGDLNNDGFLDIQVGNTVKFAIPNGNNWLKVAYKGLTSNSNGIGARVEIYGAWGKQIRDVRSGEGFEFMSSLNTHFGLGLATAIQRIVIRWPSGTVDEILNPAINSLLLITEGETLLKNNSFNANTEFSIFPNPATDVLNVSTKNNETTIASVKIQYLNGKLISNTKIVNNTIDIKSLAIGTYILVIKTSEDKQFTSKFIKK